MRLYIILINNLAKDKKIRCAMKHFFITIIVVLSLMSCNKNKKNNDVNTTAKKIGVLLVSHGSRSVEWRTMLLAVEDSVKNEIMKNKSITQIKSAFMEYTEPSIATRMKEFDNEGFTDIIIVPLFLTVSGHAFDDIPTIVGLKNSQSDIEKLRAERIDVYKAKANILITPLLDFTEILKKNIVTRTKMLSNDPSNESCVFVAYGDLDYNKEWTALMNKLINEVNNQIGINKSSFAWCGHIAHYDPKYTTDAINDNLKEKNKVIVIPVLVAYDEMFQGRIIGDAIAKVKNKENVIYKPDAILPDNNIDKWVIDIVNQYTDKIAKN